MMTRAEHYRQAEALLSAAAKQRPDSEAAPFFTWRGIGHALLALATDDLVAEVRRTNEVEVIP